MVYTKTNDLLGKLNSFERMESFDFLTAFELCLAMMKKYILVLIRVRNPGGPDPNLGPDPTFKEKLDPDAAVKKRPCPGSHLILT